MDPTIPASFNHRTESLSTGHAYHFIDQIPEGFDPAKTQTILCIHGFPDFWYGWRYQIAPWVNAGYRVIVPDMLGYGGTDKPLKVENYTTKSLDGDLAALLDLIGVQKAIVIGHDWGAAVAWRFALYFPDRVLTLTSLSIPYVPPAPTYIPLEEIVQRIPNFGYQVYFEDKSSTTEIEQNLELFLVTLHKHPYSESGRKRPSITRLTELQKLLREGLKDESADGTILNGPERDYYLEQFRKGGMHGPLSYYRTTRLRFEDEKEANLPSALSPTFPVLFLWGAKDPTCSAQHTERMQKFIPDLRIVKLEGVGHWIMVEAKEIVSQEVLKFLGDVLKSEVISSDSKL